MRITTIQVRTQGTFEVEEFSDRVFGGHFQTPMGPGRRPGGGGGQEAKPPEANRLLDSTYLQSSFLS